LQHDIGPSLDQRVKLRQAIGVAQVQDPRALAPIDALEGGGRAIQKGRPPVARVVAGGLSFPLRIEVAAGGMKQEPTAFHPDATARLLAKLDWPALRATAAALGIAELPAAPPAKPEEDLEFLKSVHDLVMDIHVTEGALVCPNCARSYPIRKGIPNMLLREDE
jgi:multifunctional methyltransferase subunit TRM112